MDCYVKLGKLISKLAEQKKKSLTERQEAQELSWWFQRKQPE